MRRSLVYTLFSALITVTVFTWIFRHVTLREVLALIRNVDLRGVALFLLCSFAMSVFRTWRYGLALRAVGVQAPGVPLFLAVVVRNMCSDLLPARIGSLAYVYVTTVRLGVPLSAATSSFAQAFLFDLLAIVPLILVAVPSLGGRAAGAMTIFGLVLGAGTLAVLFVLPRALTVLALPKRVPPRWREGIRKVAAELEACRAAGLYAPLMVLSVLVRLFKYASLYFFLFALVAPLGYGWDRLPAAKTFVGLVASEAAASLPISGLAGFGAYEGAWATVFRLLLFPAELAKMTSVAHHLFTQLYGYLLGALGLLLLLAPFWPRATAAPATRPVAARAFAVKVLLALVVIGIAGIGLYAVFPATSAPPPAEDAERPPIRGKVVFERPDGIYVAPVDGSTPPRRLAKGTWPRWSPDGQSIAFVREGAVWLIGETGANETLLARAEAPRAVAFHPSGDELYFTDGENIRALDLRTRRARRVTSGMDFRELDVAPDGRLICTVRRRGVHMYGYDPRADRLWRVCSGCSASFSPDGRRVTNNSGDHRTLLLRDFETGEVVGRISAPPGLRFDNQFWSNHENWIASRSEGPWEDVYIHDVNRDKAFRVTRLGSCDRPDLFVED